MTTPVTPPPAGPTKFQWNSENVEDLNYYKPGGFHPVHLGDTFSSLLGSTLPRYRVLHKLGYDALSTVWLARDLSNDRTYVALKFNVACISDCNNESSILQWLKTQPLSHPGRPHVLSLQDSFFVSGPNGKHEVQVTDLVAPLEGLGGRKILEDHPKRACLQALIGLAYFQECGVSHNIEYPVLTPVVPLDNSVETNSLPKYLVEPMALLGIAIDIFKSTLGPDIRILITGFGNAFRPIDARQPPHTLAAIEASKIRFRCMLVALIDDDLGLKSDVWSLLACTLHEIGFGYPTFSGEGQEDSAIREMVTLCGELHAQWQSYWSAVLSSEDEAPPVPGVEESWLRRRESLLKTLKAPDSAQFIDGLTDLLRPMMRLDPSERPLASDLLNHPWFDELKKLEFVSLP